MKFQFEPDQQYQLDAINAVVDIFAGQPFNDSYALSENQKVLELDGQQLSLESVSSRANFCNLTNTQIAENVLKIQNNNNLEPSEVKSEELQTEDGQAITTEDDEPIVLDGYDYLKNGMNFSVEMETGTGKTYVYLRTIHELHQKYGWKKFIIVVPSVAIKEGVLKNLEITKDHFAELYEKPEMNFYVWDSKKTGQAREFATNDTLQIMVITIDSFARAETIMNKISDYGKPLEFIKSTKPVVIVDEPQNMETDIRKKAITSLNPLCTLRYSATHKNTYNLMYRLTPVDAYDKNLVKKIEVHSVTSDASGAYVSLLRIERQGKNRLIAHVEVDRSDEAGLQRKVLKLTPGDNLEDLTGRSIYENYYLGSINFTEQCIEFPDVNKTIYVGQKDDALNEELVRRQIELTIEDHFEKQQKLAELNVKVLTLFFIDKVSNYREYTESGIAKGKYALWFEEAYEKVSSKPRFAGVLEGLKPEQVHNGYFAKDKSGNWKDSKDSKSEGAKTKDDDGAYSLIMKDKEKLLDTSEPLRFIFSHSALREGWDNPNVFCICTLNESTSEIKKRQEIGRGLRLPVNSDGVRIRDEKNNVLTVIANESYEEFSRKLQTEIEEEVGVSFAGRIKNRDSRKKIKITKNLKLDPSFSELWEKIKHKTTYHVNINENKLISDASKILSEITIFRPQLKDERNLIKNIENSSSAQKSYANSTLSKTNIYHVPNILERIQKRTGMTRKVIFEILDKSDIFGQITKNPELVIDEVSAIINKVKNSLAVDGIKYQKTGDYYDVTLFENDELFRYLYDQSSRSGAIEVIENEKTIYDYVEVDSEIEYNFMKELENNSKIKFYVKLPGWFKIKTPVGPYNPDWAVVFEDDEKIYFVAETKSSDKIYDDHITGDQERKITSAKRHFDELNIRFIAPINNLDDAISKINL